MILDTYPNALNQQRKDDLRKLEKLLKTENLEKPEGRKLVLQEAEDQLRVRLADLMRELADAKDDDNLLRIIQTDIGEVELMLERIREEQKKQ